MEYSDDGKFFWDGNDWQPIDESTEGSPPVTGPSGSPDDSITTSESNSNELTHHFFENNDAIYMAISALIPVAILFYVLPNFDGDEPYSMYEDLLLQILFVISCFLMIGYGYALRTRSFARVDVILATVAVPCLLWTLFAFGPWTYYMLLSVIAVGALALNIYVPKSRNFIPIISIFTMWYLTLGYLYNYGDNFVREMWSTYPSGEIGDFQQEFQNFFNILLPIFFFTTLAPSFIFGKSVDFDSSSQSHGYVSISEATQAVLPAILLILISGGLGLSIAIPSESLEGIMMGSLIAIIDTILGPEWKKIYTYALDSGMNFLSFGDSMYVEIEKCKI